MEGHLECDHLRKGLQEFRDFANKLVTGAQQTTNISENWDGLFHMYGAALHWYDDKDPEVFKLDNWVGATRADCNRLACEAGLTCFHSALEAINADERKSIGNRFPLIRCLRMTRNLAIHFRQLDVVSNDFTMVAVNHVQRDGSSLRLRFPNSWFLDVRAEELAKTDDGKNVPPATLSWFQAICLRGSLHLTSPVFYGHEQEANLFQRFNGRTMGGLAAPAAQGQAG